MTRHDPDATGPRVLYSRLADSLDPATAGRLRAARREALAGRAPMPRRAWALPAGAFAAAVLAAGLAWWMPGAPTAPPAAIAMPDAAEIDALVVEEDPELYAWLAEAPVATSRGGQP